MLDISHLANTRNGGDVQIFNALGASDFQTWVKPRGKSMVSIIAINPGGGGGGGFSAAAATARGGGGGGGGGAISRLMSIPIDVLPDALFINVGLGGPGGAAAAAGAAGGVTMVLIRPDTVLSVQNRVLQGGVAAGGGGAGAAAAVGAAGTASAVSGLFAMGSFGVFLSSVGVAGSAGGAVAGGVGTAVTWGSSSIAICGCVRGSMSKWK